MSTVRRRVALGVAGAFTLSGAVHFVRPGVFYPLMPKQLKRRRKEILYVSGAAELACAYGLFTKQPWAGRASAALLIAVWPGNFVHAQTLSDHFGATSPQAIGAWVRFPLQIPMIWGVLGPETSSCSA